MKKFLFVFLLLTKQLNAQEISLKDGHDTLLVPTNDTSFKISLLLHGIRINEKYDLTITTINRGTAFKNIDYSLQNTDSEYTDTIRIINLKKKATEFNLFVQAGEIYSYKTIIFETIINIAGKEIFTPLTIVLKPFNIRSPERKDVQPTDSLEFRLCDHDIGVQLYDSINKKSVSFYTKPCRKKKFFYDLTLNISSVSIENIIDLSDSDHSIKSKITVTDINNIRYYNQSQQLSEIKNENRLYQNGDTTKCFIYIKDFLEYRFDSIYNSDKQKKYCGDKHNVLLTPQACTTKIAVPKN